MTVPRQGTFVAFSSRDFRLLWGGQTVSFVGDAAFIVALGWRVTDLTGKASSLGFVLALESLAMLVTLLWGGVLADRHSRRLLMIGSDLARACVIAAFFVLEATGHVNLQVILVLATLFGLADGFFQPAFSGHRAARRRAADAAVGELVARQSRGTAARSSARHRRRRSTTRPARRSSGRIEAASFLVSAARALAGASARVRARPGARHAAGARRRACATSLSEPWIWTGIAAATVILMIAMAPFTALLPRVVQTHYHRGVGSYGAIFSADGRGHGRRLADLGEVAPVRATGSSSASRRSGSTTSASSCSRSHRGTRSPLAAAAWRGLWIGIGISAWMTLMSELVPERLLSRASSIDFFGSIGLTPVGFVLAGVVATLVAPTTILAVGGALGALLWFAPLTWRRCESKA